MCRALNQLRAATTKKCEMCGAVVPWCERSGVRTGHLSTSEVRLPWTPEEELRHESNGHAKYDKRCEICVKSSGISRHPRRVYSESCAFDYASVTFKESDGYVTVLTGRGHRCECFCRVCTTHRSASEGLGTFSCNHASEISLFASEI